MLKMFPTNQHVLYSESNRRLHGGFAREKEYDYTDITPSWERARV